MRNLMIGFSLFISATAFASTKYLIFEGKDGKDYCYPVDSAGKPYGYPADPSLCIAKYEFREASRGGYRCFAVDANGTAFGYSVDDAKCGSGNDTIGRGGAEHCQPIEIGGEKIGCN